MLFGSVLFTRSGTVARQIPPGRPKHLKLPPFPPPSLCNWTREERMLAASHRGVLFNEQQRPCGRWWTASRKLSSPSFPGSCVESRHSRTPRNSWPCPPSLPTVTRDNCCPLPNPPCNPPPRDNRGREHACTRNSRLSSRWARPFRMASLCCTYTNNASIYNRGLPIVPGVPIPKPAPQPFFQLDLLASIITNRL